MVLGSRQTIDPARRRAALWRKRLTGETRCLRWCPLDDGAGSTGDTVRARLLAGLFRVLGLYGRGRANAESPVLRERTVEFDALPTEFDGFRILQLSDLHFRGDKAFSDRVAGLVRGVPADLCVFTGDYRFNHWSSCRSVYRGMQTVLSALEPRHGVVAILGNNDTSQFAAGFRRMGIRVLINEHLVLEKNGARLWLAGVDDMHEFRCADLDAALDGAPAGAFTVLLAHSPELVAEAAAAGVDLYLCGHTHGGQFVLPWLGPLYVNARCPRELAAGAWRRGPMQGYTTTGIGFSTVPLRFGCPPEAVIHELRRKRPAVP